MPGRHASALVEPTRTVTVLAILALAPLVGVLLLVPLGFRSGDKPGDGLLLRIGPQAQPRGVEVTLRNTGPLPLLVGLTLRPPSLRLRLEGGSYVRLRTRRTAPDLLPSRLATIGAVEPDAQAAFGVPAEEVLGRHAELVVVMGQPGRLRSVHRAVELPPLEVKPPARRPHTRVSA